MVLFRCRPVGHHNAVNYMTIFHPTFTNFILINCHHTKPVKLTWQLETAPIILQCNVCVYVCLLCSAMATTGIKTLVLNLKLVVLFFKKLAKKWQPVLSLPKRVLQAVEKSHTFKSQTLKSSQVTFKLLNS